jgi:histidinol-phosphate/aromatic aminotransferase/cobyric acid decarboxylase-like protein
MGFPNCIRVSVGTREENAKFLGVLAELHAPAHQRAEKHPKGI